LNDSRRFEKDEQTVPMAFSADETCDVGISIGQH
jgi:hypothetical protein